MAQQAVDQQLYERIEQTLDYQWGQWGDLSWWVERWPEMDMIDKEVFQIEWSGITEYRLTELQRWAKEGLLTPEQSTRYNELARLIDERRPVLQALLNDDTAAIPALLVSSNHERDRE
jgi:hypothetical protein